MPEQDYYSVLGVSKTSSAEEIQKSYRKLARKYHPDLQGEDEKDQERAKQKFQKIQQAYDTLSDPKKRKMYDQMGPGYEQMGGQNPFGGGQSPFGGGQNPFGGGGGIDIGQMFGGGGGGGGFEDILRQMGGGGGMGGDPRRQAQAKGSDVEQEITVPFATAILGGQHQISLQRRGGKVDRIDVAVPAGIEANKKIRLRGQGNPGPGGGAAGDLLITVKICQHPNYSRKGMNLQISIPITLKEAVEGAKIDIPTPHGTVAIKVPPGTSSGKPLRLKGMGIKGKDRSGDIIATLQISIPSDPSESDLELIKKLGDKWNDEALRSELIW